MSNHLLEGPWAIDDDDPKGVLFVVGDNQNEGGMATVARIMFDRMDVAFLVAEAPRMLSALKDAKEALLDGHAEGHTDGAAYCNCTVAVAYRNCSETIRRAEGWHRGEA